MRPVENAPDVIDHRLLDQRVADLVSARGEQVKHIPPPTSNRSTSGSSASITPSLSDTFAPPITTTYGRDGSAHQPIEGFDLSGKEAPCGRTQALGDADVRSVAAVGGGKGIVHEQIAQCSKPVGDRGIIRGLPRLESSVLQYDHRLRRSRVDHRLHGLSDDTRRLDHREPAELAETLGHRSHAVRRIRAIRAPQVAGDDNGGAALP